jgi:hypothetical protein
VGLPGIGGICAPKGCPERCREVAVRPSFPENQETVDPGPVAIDAEWPSLTRWEGLRLGARPSDHLLEATWRGFDLGGYRQPRGAIDKHKIDPPPRGLMHANFEDGKPHRPEAVDQALCDGRLVAIVDSWTGVRVQPHCQVSA